MITGPCCSSCGLGDAAPQPATFKSVNWPAALGIVALGVGALWALAKLDRPKLRQLRYVPYRRGERATVSSPSVSMSELVYGSQDGV